MDYIIRGIWGSQMAFTVSSSSLMPTSGKKNGGSIFQICLLPGLIFASREFLFLVTSPIPFFVRQILHDSRPSTPSLLLSVLSTSIENALLPSSKPLRTHIRIGKSGWKVIGRKNKASKVSIHIVKLLLGNIAPFAKKVHLKPFLLCSF